MSAEQIAASPYKNKLLWSLTVVLLVGCLIANYALPTIPWLLRFVAWILISACTFGLFLSTSQGKRFWNFSKLARNELRKVVWPTRAETTQSTLFVGVMVVVLALLLWGIDSFWAWLITLITV